MWVPEWRSDTPMFIFLKNATFYEISNQNYSATTRRILDFSSSKSSPWRDLFISGVFSVELFLKSVQKHNYVTTKLTNTKLTIYGIRQFGSRVVVFLNWFLKQFNRKNAGNEQISSRAWIWATNLQNPSSGRRQTFFSDHKGGNFGP